MCRRCATSARDRPCRSRVSARTWPGDTGIGCSSAMSTALAVLFQLLQLRGIPETAADLLQVAVLRDLVAVLAGEAPAQHQGVERGLRELRVAQQVALGILVRPALVGDDGEVVERADEIRADYIRAAQVLLGLGVAAHAAQAHAGGEVGLLGRGVIVIGGGLLDRARARRRGARNA